MFKIAIVDDSATSRELIGASLNKFAIKNDLDFSYEEFSSGESFLANFDEANCYDLIFMDIFMKDLNGFETAKKIREIDDYVPVCFLTTSRDFAIESYEVNACGYLVKPLDESKMFALLARLTKRQPAKALVIMKKGRACSFEYKEITFIESHGHTITIHTDGGERDDSFYAKLDDIELDDSRFIRCHKSYMVNMDYIKFADDTFHLADGTEVPIRTRGKKEIVDEYTKYILNRFVRGEIR